MLLLKYTCEKYSFRKNHKYTVIIRRYHSHCVNKSNLENIEPKVPLWCHVRKALTKIRVYIPLFYRLVVFREINQHRSVHRLSELGE